MESVSNAIHTYFVDINIKPTQQQMDDFKGSETCPYRKYFANNCLDKINPFIDQLNNYILIASKLNVYLYWHIGC